MNIVQRTVRRVQRRLRGRPSPETWWDRVYRDHGPFQASQSLARTEEDNERCFAFRERCHREYLERVRKAWHTRFLDAACGNGLLTVVVAAMGLQVTAFDFSEEAVARSRARLRGTPSHVLGPTSIQRYRDPGVYDLVRCAEGLPCVADDREHRKAFANLAAHVALGGYLILEEHLVPASELSPMPGKHDRFRLRSLETYRDLGAEYGMRLVDYWNPVDEMVDENLEFMTLEPVGRGRATSGLGTWWSAARGIRA